MVLCPTLSVKAISLLAHALLLLVRVDPPGLRCCRHHRTQRVLVSISCFYECGFIPPLYTAFEVRDHKWIFPKRDSQCF